MSDAEKQKNAPAKTMQEVMDRASDEQCDYLHPENCEENQQKESSKAVEKKVEEEAKKFAGQQTPASGVSHS